MPAIQFEGGRGSSATVPWGVLHRNFVRTPMSLHDIGSHPHCDEFILPSMGEVIGEVSSFMYSSANRLDGERKTGRHVVHETGLCRHGYQNEHSLYQMTSLSRYDAIRVLNGRSI